jgi:hypothetical protein
MLPLRIEASAFGSKLTAQYPSMLVTASAGR